MSFKLDLSLQRLAAIAIATSCFKDSSLQKICDECLQGSKFYFSLHLSPKDHNCFNFAQQFIQEFEKMHLPKMILNEVIYVTDSLLKKYLRWQNTVFSIFKFRYRGLGEFYWTSYGTVDTAKIVGKEWISWFDDKGELHENLKSKFELIPLKERSSKVKQAMYYMVCNCVLIDYIECHSHDMLKFCEERDSFQSSFVGYSVSAITYYEGLTELLTRHVSRKCVLLISRYETLNACKNYIYLCKSKDVTRIIQEEMDALKEKFSDLKELLRTTEEDIKYAIESLSALEDQISESTIRLCLILIKHGWAITLRYYWGWLNSKHREECLKQAATAFFTSRKRIGFDDIPIFLFMETSKDQRQKRLFKEIITGDGIKVTNFIERFIDNFPYEELFIPVFDSMKMYLNKNNCYTLLKIITQKMIDIKCKVGYDHKSTIYYKMFFTVFDEIRAWTSKGSPRLIPEYTDGSEFIDLSDNYILKLMSEFECNDKKWIK